MDNIKNPWKIKSSKVEYDNAWIRVREDKVINPAGNPGIYGVVEFKNLAIGILPLTKDGYTWIVGQYRYPLNEYSWEIPEGGGELGVDPLVSAKRELSEEAGLSAKHWQLIQEFNTSNSVTNEISLIYLAQGIEVGEAHPDEDELLVLKKIHFNDLFDMVMKGEIKDSLSIIAILKAKEMINKGLIQLSNYI